MVKITRVIPTPVPGNMGWYEGAPEVTDGTFTMNFANGETLTQSPSRAVPNNQYYDRKILIGLNNGQATPSDLPGQWRGMFGKDGIFSDRRPDTELHQFSEDEIRQALRNAWAAKGPWKLICGEAQESSNKSRFQTDYAPNQVRWAYDELGKMATEYNFINAGLMYCTHSTIWPGKSGGGMTANYDTIKTGFSSPAQARALLAAFEWSFNRYWSMELYKTGVMPVTNAYNTINDRHTQFWAVILQMELAAKALEGIFADPRTQMLFTWARARELQPYTESYPADMGDGIIMNTAEWPLPEPNLIMRLLRYGFRHGKHVWNWENPYLHGKDKNLMPSTGPRISYPNGTGSKQVVDQYQPAPFKNGISYAYSNAPFGYNDLPVVAGKMHMQQCNFLNKRPTPVQWAINGANGPAPDAGYIPYCIDNHKPYILAAVEGNRATVDGYSPDGKGFVAEVNLGGSFGKQTIEFWPGVDNQLHLEA